MGTKKIIEEACTGEDLCNKTTYAIKEMPVETNPRKRQLNKFLEINQKKKIAAQIEIKV